MISKKQTMLISSSVLITSLCWVALIFLVNHIKLSQSGTDPYTLARREVLKKDFVTELVVLPSDVAGRVNLSNQASYAGTSIQLSNNKHGETFAEIKGLIKSLDIAPGCPPEYGGTVISCVVHIFSQPPMLLDVSNDGLILFAEQWSDHTGSNIGHAVSKDLSDKIIRFAGDNALLHK